MPKTYAYACFDSKVGAYMQPFFCRSKGEALRSFTTTVNDGQSMLSKFPTDFDLFEIGCFDDSTGRFEPHDALVPLGKAIEFKSQQADLPLAPSSSRPLSAV